jgi:hypothetical protein
LFNTKLNNYGEIYPSCLIFEENEEEQGDKVHYLDLEITIVRGKLHTKHYSKLDHLNIIIIPLVPPDTNVKNSMVKNIIYSQLLRFYKINSSFSDFLNTSIKYLEKYQALDYNNFLLLKAVSNFVYINLNLIRLKYSINYEPKSLIKSIFSEH